MKHDFTHMFDKEEKLDSLPDIDTREVGKDFIEIVGPCSRWIEGRGWVTKIPIRLIKKAGFVKDDTRSD